MGEVQERSELECVVEGALAGLSTVVAGLMSGGLLLAVAAIVACPRQVTPSTITSLSAPGDLMRLEDLVSLAPLIVLIGALPAATLVGHFETRTWRKATRAWLVVALAVVAGAGTWASPLASTAGSMWLALGAGGVLGGIGFLRPPRTGW